MYIMKGRREVVGAGVIKLIHELEGAKMISSMQSNDDAYVFNVHAGPSRDDAAAVVVAVQD